MLRFSTKLGVRVVTFEGFEPLSTLERFDANEPCTIIVGWLGGKYHGTWVCNGQPGYFQLCAYYYMYANYMARGAAPAKVALTITSAVDEEMRASFEAAGLDDVAISALINNLVREKKGVGSNERKDKQDSVVHP